MTLKHIDKVKAASGAVYYYFRPPGRPRIRLPGAPGSPEFMAAYNEAVAAMPASVGGAARWQPYTMAHLAALYYETPKFKAKSERTRYVERRKFDAFMIEYGSLPARSLATRHLDAIFAKMADRPMAAMDLRKRLRNLTRHMIKLGWRADDPITATDTYSGGEVHTWTHEELEQYRARWKVGTKQRAAFDLALYTGQRRSDLARMTWPDIAGGVLRIRQDKTGEELAIPLHPALLDSLTVLGRAHVAIITTEFGKPFTTAGFGNWMADAIDAAGLPTRCVLHGLRKAAGAALAEAGCTEKEIAAVTGHRTLKEVARYTKGAQQRALATAAVGKMVNFPSQNDSQKSRNDRKNNA